MPPRPRWNGAYNSTTATTKENRTKPTHSTSLSPAGRRSDPLSASPSAASISPSALGAIPDWSRQPTSHAQERQHYAQLKDQYIRLSSQMHSKDARISQLTNELREARSTIERLNQESTIHQLQLNRMKQQMSQAQGEALTATTALRKLESRLSSSASAKHNLSKAHVASLVVSVTNLRARVEADAERIGQLEHDLDESRAREALLQTAVRVRAVDILEQSDESRVKEEKVREYVDEQKRKIEKEAARDQKEEDEYEDDRDENQPIHHQPRHTASIPPCDFDSFGIGVHRDFDSHDDDDVHDDDDEQPRLVPPSPHESSANNTTHSTPPHAHSPPSPHSTRDESKIHEIFSPEPNQSTTQAENTPSHTRDGSYIHEIFSPDPPSNPHVKSRPNSHRPAAAAAAAPPLPPSSSHLPITSSANTSGTISSFCSSTSSTSSSSTPSRAVHALLERVAFLESALASSLDRASHRDADTRDLTRRCEEDVQKAQHQYEEALGRAIKSEELVHSLTIDVKRIARKNGAFEQTIAQLHTAAHQQRVTLDQLTADKARCLEELSTLGDELRLARRERDVHRSSRVELQNKIRELAEWNMELLRDSHKTHSALESERRKRRRTQERVCEVEDACDELVDAKEYELECTRRRTEQLVQQVEQKCVHMVHAKEEQLKHIKHEYDTWLLEETKQFEQLKERLKEETTTVTTKQMNDMKQQQQQQQQHADEERRERALRAVEQKLEDFIKEQHQQQPPYPPPQSPSHTFPPPSHARQSTPSDQLQSSQPQSSSRFSSPPSMGVIASNAGQPDVSAGHVDGPSNAPESVRSTPNKRPIPSYTDHRSTHPQLKPIPTALTQPIELPPFITRDHAPGAKAVKQNNTDANRNNRSDEPVAVDQRRSRPHGVSQSASTRVGRSRSRRRVAPVDTSFASTLSTGSSSLATDDADLTPPSSPHSRPHQRGGATRSKSRSGSRHRHYAASRSRSRSHTRRSTSDQRTTRTRQQRHQQQQQQHLRDERSQPSPHMYLHASKEMTRKLAKDNFILSPTSQNGTPVRDDGRHRSNNSHSRSRSRTRSASAHRSSPSFRRSSSRSRDFGRSGRTDSSVSRSRPCTPPQRNRASRSRSRSRSNETRTPRARHSPMSSKVTSDRVASHVASPWPAGTDAMEFVQHVIQDPHTTATIRLRARYGPFDLIVCDGIDVLSDEHWRMNGDGVTHFIDGRVVAQMSLLAWAAEKRENDKKEANYQTEQHIIHNTQQQQQQPQQQQGDRLIANSSPSHALPNDAPPVALPLPASSPTTTAPVSLRISPTRPAAVVPALSDEPSAMRPAPAHQVVGAHAPLAGVVRTSVASGTSPMHQSNRAAQTSISSGLSLSSSSLGSSPYASALSSMSPLSRSKSSSNFSSSATSSASSLSHSASRSVVSPPPVSSRVRPSLVDLAASGDVGVDEVSGEYHPQPSTQKRTSNQTFDSLTSPDEDQEFEIGRWETERREKQMNGASTKKTTTPLDMPALRPVDPIDSSHTRSSVTGTSLGSIESGRGRPYASYDDSWTVSDSVGTLSDEDDDADTPTTFDSLDDDLSEVSSTGFGRSNAPLPRVHISPSAQHAHATRTHAHGMTKLSATNDRPEDTLSDSLEDDDTDTLDDSQPPQPPACLFESTDVTRDDDATTYRGASPIHPPRSQSHHLADTNSVATHASARVAAHAPSLASRGDSTSAPPPRSSRFQPFLAQSSPPSRSTRAATSGTSRLLPQPRRATHDAHASAPAPVVAPRRTAPVDVSPRSQLKEAAARLKEARQAHIERR